ncbi:MULTISPECIES: hypothetical protein [unclassified Paenarthrobacter]|uniref:hypothetical protein n=1 Tax=unclassified Paenarthrobacter TaxID=2634190 RepID=UPI00084EB241|nr:hypothetical protein [Paenarthrobacter sp. R1]NKR10607.1 hypothetical protein [Arthrobacter sp. M5]NKR16447.1 hypothetical protein [Arthrobacter sp. M6]OEH61441.1 hypothetical protein A5N13_17020 [Arthrobacter sp. D4]OEH64427.1 hypothetical protein A5N17_06415 [Arthrobacter sp. D2]WIV29211.1 hypothetical protein QN084_12575 [Paenarthrobacter sp. R1]
MTIALGRRSRMFLRRAGILAGTLILIAGVFGMHILSSSHDVHAAYASPVAATQLDGYVPALDERVPRQPSGVATDPSAPISDGPSACLDPITCPAMSTTAQECTPAPANTAFEAPGPGEALRAARIDTAARPLTCRTSSPASPSPGALGISRT